MILQFKGPRAHNIYEVLKRKFEITYSLKDVPLTKYLTFEEARLLYPTDTLEQDLVTSNKIYAFEFNQDQMFVHPDPIIDAVKKHHRRRIKKMVSVSEKPDSQLVH